MTILNINEKEYSLDLKGHETLLEVLRDTLGLTGTKTACNEAECGACTVLVDDKSVLACITLAKNVEGCKILTIEGLSRGEELHPIQQAFLDNGAVQCGFCAPGFILSTKSLLNRNPKPNLDEIKKSLDGHICRCGGYLKIFDAVKDASQKLNNHDNKE
ncbi:MAG: (2Fe-2S)-binding protein [Candidatus Omnitrophica bacterium]|nr:(2Fe-2S)-binding protein [Candidatus Omnitrophota bacterium]